MTPDPGIYRENHRRRNRLATIAGIVVSFILGGISCGLLLAVFLYRWWGF